MLKNMWRKLHVIGVVLVMFIPNTFNVHAEETSKEIGYLIPNGFERKDLSGTVTSTISITKNTVIVFTGDTTINVTSGNGILIADNITVTLALCGNNVTVKTSAVGKAGIRVPRDAKLIVKEGTLVGGTLNVTGGPGRAPEAGGNGGVGDVNRNGGEPMFIYSGSGGKGGKGGDAPGSGIGGDGSPGGAAVSATYVIDVRKHEQKSGAQGAAGKNSELLPDGGNKSGDVFLFGKITVNASGGMLPSNSISQAKVPSESYDRVGGRVAVHGGAGGAGGTAYGSPGIGSGGIGGGSGGAGGSGSAIWRDNGDTFTSSYPGAGGGGGGQTGGIAGETGGLSSGDIALRATDSKNGTSNAGGTGGSAKQGTGMYGWPIYAGGNGGAGGASASRLNSSEIGKTYVDSKATLNANTSAGSTTNSSANEVIRKNIYLLSELDITVVDEEKVKYTGVSIQPTLSIKDKNGNEVKSVLNKNYSISYNKNIDAGDQTATMTFSSAGSQNDENHIFVEDGTHTYPFSIFPNDDPISITKADAFMSYTYGDSFKATVNKNSYNKGKIVWSGVLDDTHTGNAIGASTTDATTDIIPTKVGQLKLKVSITQETKNSNGCYNFVDLEATLDNDIEIKRRDIADSVIGYNALKNYTYLGAQIQPHYTVDDGNTEIKYITNKDKAHINLAEDADFELSYGENLNIGKGTVTVKGIGNYIGETTKDFTIIARDINDKDVSISRTDEVFTGKDIFALPTIKILNNTLPASDRELSWDSFGEDGNLNDKKDLINVGKKQITITGNGNITGTRTIDFNIVEADIGKVALNVTEAKDVIFDGKEIESRPSLKYNDIILTEDKTPVDTSQPIINPNDYEISFKDHKEVGTATITLTGINNFKGTKTLTYEVLPRPLYILPDAGQWKYYGAKDIFGVYQDKANPTYQVYTRQLNESCTEELKDGDAIKDKDYMMFVNNNLPITDYPIDLLGNLSREGADNIVANDKPNRTYKYIINDLKLSDLTKENYAVKLIDNQNYYKLESYLYDGPNIELDGVIGKNDWYITKPALLHAPNGFTISKKDDMDTNINPWSQKISYDDGDYSKAGVSYFVRVDNPGSPADGAISSSNTKQFKQDTVFPTGNLLINKDSFNVLNGNAEFNFYLNSDLNGMIFAKDDISQVASKLYYISDTKLDKNELDSLTIPKSGDNIYNPIGGSTGIPVDYDGKTWIDEGQFRMSIDTYNTQSKMLYVRIEDNAGNVTYLNSDGIVFDKDAPILKAEYKQDNQWTIDENVYISGNVYDETSGLKDRYVAYQMDDGVLQIIDTKDIQNGDFHIKNIKDGHYNLTISAWDKANNQAAPITFHVMKDTQMPRIILEADTTTIASQQLIKFKPNVGVSGVAKLEVSYNNGEFVTVENGVLATYYAKQNGTYTFRITNGAGIISKESSITFTKIDPNQPIIDLTITNIKETMIQDNDFVNSRINILFKNIEKNLGDSLFEYQLDGGHWIEVTENLDNEAMLSIIEGEGKHTLKFRITAKNGLTAEKEFHFIVDLTAPMVAGNITVEDAEGGFFRAIIDFFTNKKQKVTMNATDALSGVASTQYYIVKGKDTLKTLPTDEKGIEKMVDSKWNNGESCEVDKGSEYIVYFKVMDKAGNIAYARSDRIVIDNAAPEIEVTYEKDGQWDANPTFNVYVWDANPGVQSVEYSVDGAPSISAGESFTVNNLSLSSGNHTVEIKTEDKSGNKSTKTVNIKYDAGKPIIDAQNTGETENEVTIEVEASYSGPSGLSQILVSKNQQDFEDITDEIKRNGFYLASENGEYMFRAVTGAGATQDAIINIDKFTATADNLKAVVSAKTIDGKKYETQTWTNQDVTVQFSNEIANLKGLTYQIKRDDGPWEVVNAVNGYVSLPVSAEGKYHYECKVILIGAPSNIESNIVSIDVYIDKTVPTGIMKIQDMTWDKKDLVFSFDNYFNASQYAEIINADSNSGVKGIEMFVIKESDIPSSIKGTTVASQIEELGKNRWQKVNRIVIDPSDKYIAFGKIYDYAGNISYLSSDGVVFDNVNPTLKTDIDQVNWYKDNITDITFDTDDNLAEVKEVYYSINNQSRQKATLNYGSFILSSGVLDNGVNNVKVEVIDNAKNTLVSEFIAKKDDELPVIKIEDLTNSPKLVTKHLLSIEASAGKSGIAKVEVKLPDAGEWINITETYKDDFIAEENGTYWFRVVSGSGVNTVTSMTLGNISKNIPVITYVMSNADGSTYHSGEWKKDNVKVQFTNENANQIVDKYMYRIDSGAYQTLKEQKDNSAIFESVDGQHTYTMKLILANGLESEEVSVSIMIDSKNPRIQVNSDLSQWVREAQELEVEVIDNESGIANNGYSFDNGYTWQSDNKAKIHANKLVGVYAKDNVSNTSKEKVVIDKIDSQGPTVEVFKQIGNEQAKSRTLEAEITDYKDLTNQAGSGIKDAFIMTSYPYKNGEFEANPDKTYAMEEVNGTWQTEQAVSVPYNGTNNVWLVTEDKVGNMKIYSTKVDNMIGSGDDEGNTDRPVPIEPTNPDKPNTGDNPSPNKPSIKGPESQNKPNSSTNTKIIEETVINETIIKRADSVNGSKEDAKKLAELEASLKKGKETLTNIKKISITEYIYLLPWILVILFVIWGIYLRRKYLKIKKSYEENNKEV